MFVESMSFPEMRRQANADMPMLCKKVVQHVDAIIKVMRKTHLTRFNKYYEYIIPHSKNRWLYKIISNGKREQTEVIIMCYFSTSKGYAGISYCMRSKRMFYYIPHFFDRYCERKLDIKNVKELMMTYVEENSQTVIIPKGEIIDGMREINLQIKQGFGFGTHHTEIDFVEMRTFINNNMLRGDQVELSYEIEKKYNLEIDRPKNKSLKERPYLYNIVYPLPHFLTGILQNGATRYNTALLKFL